MSLELVSWVAGNNRWTGTHLTKDGIWTLCGKLVHMGFGRRRIDLFRPSVDFSEKPTCRKCTTIYRRGDIK